MNRLASEASPYLRQHRDNPVDWYPWGPDAFATAVERGVPVLLSVGYSACHWCHVMAHESFEDADVAARMNKSFVNIKVDREERPDVDAIYMDAVQAMTGRGGWPMTVFLTPEAEPFYGGTYFPKPTFLQLIDAISTAWRDRRADLDNNVVALRDSLERSARLTAGSATPDEALIPAAVEAINGTFDPDWGGFGAAPKFPSTMALDLILAEVLHLGTVASEEAPAEERPATASAARERNERTPGYLATVSMSLDGMASGGIYDHIGGGFARYSVDERWLVPHFEKMLYDQALLVRVYAHAASATGTERWRAVVAETVEYVLRDLRQPGSGFASAEDADSPGPDGHNHEGLFYTWTPNEVADVVGADSAALCEFYDITPEGNFAEEGVRRSIPNRIGKWPADWRRPPAVETARRALFEARLARPRPGLDDKVLTEWNALMISSLAEAGALLDEQPWIDAAADAARFLVAELRTESGRWRRAWHASSEPRARHDALAADHAALVDAFVRLAEADGEATWIAEAAATADTLLDHFWDVDQGGLFTTPDDGERLIVRQKDIFDSATPSANSTAAVALLRLGALTGEARYANHADRILQLIAPLVPRAASGFANALGALALRTRGVTEIVVAGDRPDLLEVVRERWRPRAVVAWGERYDSPLWDGRRDGLAYVCEHYACQAPAETPEFLRQQL